MIIFKWVLVIVLILKLLVQIILYKIIHKLINNFGLFIKKSLLDSLKSIRDLYYFSPKVIFIYSIIDVLVLILLLFN